ncbi:MAG TPA: tetratricopeptide repeat protein [Oculatellaceae cyanobacterium]
MNVIDSLKESISAYEDGHWTRALVTGEEAKQEAEKKGKHTYEALLWYGKFNLDLWYIKVAEELVAVASTITDKKLEIDFADGRYDIEFLAAELKAKKRHFQEAIEEAESILQSRMAKEDASGLKVAAALQAIGQIYLDANRFVEAESALRRALVIRGNKLGKEHLLYAETLNSLGMTYSAQQEYVRAQPFCKLALNIREKLLPPNHLLIAFSLHENAKLKLHAFRVSEAEAFWRRALTIAESELPASHPKISQIMSGLASALLTDYQYAAAREFYERALTAAEAAYPQRVADVFVAASGLGAACLADHKFEQAEPLIRRALSLLKEYDELQYSNESALVENLITSQMLQGKVIDAMSLFPDQMRARHTGNFARTIKRLEMLVNFIQLNLPDEVARDLDKFTEQFGKNKRR